MGWGKIKFFLFCLILGTKGREIGREKTQFSWVSRCTEEFLLGQVSEILDSINPRKVTPWTPRVPSSESLRINERVVINSDLANLLALILLKKFSAKSIPVLSFIFLKNQCVITQQILTGASWIQHTAHGAGPGVGWEEAILSAGETSCAAFSKADGKRPSPALWSIGNYLWCISLEQVLLLKCFCFTYFL